MKHIFLFVMFAVATLAESPQLPDAAGLPAPPSVAINPTKFPASSPVYFSVDVIPAEAKYVIYAQMNLAGLTIEPDKVNQIGAELSRDFVQLVTLARERGANLIVLFSNLHGMAVPIKQCNRALTLRPADPVVTAVLFQWKSAAGFRAGEEHLRFTTTPPPEKVENIHYTISLEKDTAGITKSYWTYGNIARFVQDAMAHSFDTIAMKPTNDANFEEVWLPGCDVPLKVSTNKPVLDVTLFKRIEPKQSP